MLRRVQLVARSSGREKSSECRRNAEASIDKRNMAQDAAKGFPGCSDIMRLFIKDTTRSATSRSTETQWVGGGPRRSGPRQKWFERGVVVLQKSCSWMGMREASDDEA